MANNLREGATTLTVHDIPSQLLDALKEQARSAGITLREKLIAVLREATKTPESSSYIAPQDWSEILEEIKSK